MLTPDLRISNILLSWQNSQMVYHSSLWIGEQTLISQTVRPRVQQRRLAILSLKNETVALQHGTVIVLPQQRI